MGLGCGDVIGDGRLDPNRSTGERVDRYFNTAAFSVPTVPGTYGNAGRNLLIGPGDTQTDLAVNRRFVLPGEWGRFEFRGEAAGVTFVVSMLERVIEEQARGDPSRANEIRSEITRADAEMWQDTAGEAPNAGDESLADLITRVNAIRPIADGKVA